MCFPNLPSWHHLLFATSSLSAASWFGDGNDKAAVGHDPLLPRGLENLDLKISFVLAYDPSMYGTQGKLEPYQLIFMSAFPLHEQSRMPILPSYPRRTHPGFQNFQNVMLQRKPSHTGSSVCEMRCVRQHS